MARFDPGPLVRGHWKSLQQFGSNKPAWAVRVALVLIPVAVGVYVGLCPQRLSGVEALLAGLGLLAGALLAAFAQLSVWRQELTFRDPKYIHTEKHVRDSLDETVAHLLVAAYASAVTAATVVITLNVSADEAGKVIGWGAGVLAGMSTYVLLLFLLIVPRLYSAYVNLNKVPHYLSGYNKGHPIDSTANDGKTAHIPD